MEQASSAIPVGRFAPSPSGMMHAGNIFSALVSWLLIKSLDGRIVLRIDDLDASRSKNEYADAIRRDFESLGLTWDGEELFQHEREEAYQTAFNFLSEKGMVYSCFCSRADLHSAQAPHANERYVYAGTCRNLSCEAQYELMKAKQPSYRIEVPDLEVKLDDMFQGPYALNLEKDIGDFIIRRADGGYAYQLACVLDDDYQGVNLIVRGIDLLSSTPQQIYLQHVLSCTTPRYAHVPLLVNKDGKRLSKRDSDADIRVMRQTLKTNEGIIGALAYLSGMIDYFEPITANELLQLARTGNIFSALEKKSEIIFSLDQFSKL